MENEIKERFDKDCIEIDTRGIPTFRKWWENHVGLIFRYWVYKRMYTPYEQQEKFSDETLFEDDVCAYGYIKEAIALPDGDILIGFLSVSEECPSIDYYKLSEIRLAYVMEDEENESFS